MLSHKDKADLKGTESMLTEILNYSSVQRLKGILQSRYGKGLKVKFMMDVTSIEPTAQSPSRVGGDLRILISSDGEFLAEASIENGCTLSDEDQETASILVKMVLEPAIQNWKRQGEDPITSPMTRGEDQTNVIQIRNSFKPKDSVDFEMDSLHSKALSTSVMFLQGQNPHGLQKVTAEIHEISQRWAKLNFSDIRSEVQSVEDICDLGTMTIVADLLIMSPVEQNLLASFLEVADVSKNPLVLFTSTSSIRHLEMQSMITPRMVSLLQKCIVEVDRLPASPSLFRESLELFLEPEAMI